METDPPDSADGAAPAGETPNNPAKCPQCYDALIRPVVPEGMFPRYRACGSCSFPLDFAKLADRVAEGPVTEVLVGYMSDPDLYVVRPERLKSIPRILSLGSAAAEFEKGVIFWAVNDYYIFNFGPAGQCPKYWSEFWEYHARSQSAQAIANLVSGYRRGTMGPSLMWGFLFDKLTPETTDAVLNDLTPESQHQLRKSYEECPYRPLENEEITPVYREVIRWCLKNRDPDLVIGSIAQQHLRNVTSAQVLWQQIVSCLTAANACASLASQYTPVQILLRAIYADQPGALMSADTDHAVRAEIERWCQGA